MQNKNILIITPFFAPETHAAVFRAHKLVKYLKREGWSPIVLTVATNYVYNEDISLLEDLQGVPIYRTKYIEPSLRGLYMCLTGKDRTFKTLKKQGEFSLKELATKETVQNKFSLKEKVYKYILDNYLNVPDRFWTWKNGAVTKANQLIKEQQIKYIYTTMPPFTTGSIGLKIKKNNPTIKWIADFRDPLTTVLRNHSEIIHVYAKQKKIKYQVIEHSSAVLTASLAHKNILHDIFKGKFFEKMHFIPTGLDNDFWIEKSEKLENSIIYSGEYLIENGFYIFDLIQKYNLTAIEKVKLKIIGSKEINFNLINKNVTNQLLLDNVEFIDHMPQKILYQELVKSKACLLISEGRWWCSFAKMVDYIALQVLVIAQVPEISEAKTQLNNANIGHFLSGNMEEDIEVLKNICNSEVSMVPNVNFCKKYLASSQVKQFIQIMESL